MMGFGWIVDLICNENMRVKRKIMGLTELWIWILYMLSVHEKLKKKDGFWAICGFDLLRKIRKNTGFGRIVDLTCNENMQAWKKNDGFCVSCGFDFFTFHMKMKRKIMGSEWIVDLTKTKTKKKKKKYFLAP